MAPVIRGNSIYTIVDGPSWSQAEANSVKLGGHLVTINDNSENNFIYSYFNQIISIAAWIGITDRAKEGEWRTVEGEIIPYSAWANGEPNTYNGIEEDFTVICFDSLGIASYSGKWNDVPGFLASSSWGVWSSVISGIAETPFIRRGDSAYVIVQGPTWEEAEANAVKLGGHLVTVNDKEENDFLYNSFIQPKIGTPFLPEPFINGFRYWGAYWIGLSDKIKEGNWQWISGENSNYSNWYGNVGGDDAHGGQDYGVFGWQWSNSWDDGGGPGGGKQEGLYGIAEIKLSIPTPTYSIGTISSINEGATLTTTINTANVASGTTLYYSLSGTGITTSDFSSGALTGSGTVASNGSFAFSHTLANDLTTEGSETLNIKLFSDSSLLTQVGSTASVSIADTSITPVIKNTGAANFSISGKGDIGSQLSIIKTKDDPEGNGKFTYKWQSSVDGTNWTNLAATSSSYTIAAIDASKQLRASISYLDGKSNSESVDTSALSISAVATTKLIAGDFATPANINLSLPAYVMSTNWNIDKYYYYVEQYPMTLRTAFYADYLAGRYTNQALYGQNHYLTGGQAEGRSLPGTDGILPDSNDYGAYVENYGITLLDIYRVDKRAVVNGGTMSLFAWGKEHYTNWGKAEGREITGGVEWGGIVRNNLDLYNQWQDAKIVNPTLSAFAFGYQRQNTIKSTLGVLVGSDTADKLTGQIAYGLNGNDVICSDGGRGILAGGFGDDLLVAANGGSDLAYGGPGSDIFQLNAGSSFNIRDFRKGADMIQLGSTLTSSGVTIQWDSADNSTLFYNGTSVIGKVYGKRPTEFTYSDSTDGVSKVYI